MSNATKLISGILLIIVPTIEYDDTFLLHPLRQGAASSSISSARCFVRATPMLACL